MKTSINFKAVKSDSETHNFRKKTFYYIRTELTAKNEYWQQEKISARVSKIEAYCKQKSGRKLQSNAIPIREAVVVIKEDTTMKDLHDLGKKLEQELGIRIFQIAIHKDEGHWDKEAKEWKPNLHAHLVADWQDQKTGKTLKHKSFHYSKMQDLAAECLGMERGTAGSIGRLEAVEFKIKKKEEEYKALEQKVKDMRTELGSGKFKDLIIKEPDFLGFQRIKTEKTIENYEKAFKIYNSRLLKNKNELEAKQKQIAEQQNKLQDLKKEVAQLKNKNSALLTDPHIFALEKKKYMDSLIGLLEKSIRDERFRNPNKDRSDRQQLLHEMNKICKEVSVKNDIPFSAFEAVFQAAELATDLFSLLSIGSGNNPEPEEIPLQKKKKRRRIYRG
ncbi:hypothetical protein EGI16_12895 [Chryseobacterium sp. G0240]|uniref:hypothetical protein n=1 Tax=Chryseobacterium sp. G0240 TaxID=2487066 RepID=UPI000F4585E7|nr:hypothetical protein [Chryseobacterium sp. G0240]ROI02530.1 hypothetical protein EGI16_12895 [Chryseobacterium sp. G0240]